MDIHCSARFQNLTLAHHNHFDVNAPEQIILENKEKVTNLAIQNFKEKCANYFKVDFSTMVFFEVYFYREDKEVTIFKKEKTV